MAWGTFEPEAGSVYLTPEREREREREREEDREGEREEDREGEREEEREEERGRGRERRGRAERERETVRVCVYACDHVESKACPRDAPDRTRRVRLG